MSTATSDRTRPAFLGGPRAVGDNHDEALRWPIIGEEDEAAVRRVLRSGELSIHREVADLEDDYRRWLGIDHAVAHCNGTSALHAAMHAFDIGPRDEVIVPSATWWASVMPVLHQGGIPVFAETEPITLGLDPADVETRITARTRAIVVVHLFGIPSRMDELLDVARRHDLRVLEDASHAHGATWRDRPVGTLGDAAVFSMQVNKLCPSAEGGMLVTRDRALHDKVVRYGHYERLLSMTDSPERRFAATGFGFKFRMSPLSAAVARVQLRHLEERNRLRNANCRRLAERLEPLGFETFTTGDAAGRVFFEFVVRAPENGPPATALVKALQAEGARVSAPRYPLLHQQPMFTEGTWRRVARLDESDGPLPVHDPADLPRTVAANARLLRLPTFPHAEPDLLDRYAEAFEKVLAHADRIPRENA